MAHACSCTGSCEIMGFASTNYNSQDPGGLEKWSLLQLYQGCSSQVAALEVHTAAVISAGATGRQLMLAQGDTSSSAQTELGFLPV